MRTQRERIPTFLGLSVIFLASCGGGGGGNATPKITPNPPVVPTPDTSPPVIVSTNPSQNQTEVDPLSSITVSFNEPIDVNSLNSTNFSVQDSSGSIDGSFNYISTSATVRFTPANPLSLLTTYTVAISGEITDLAGNPLGNDYSWSFSTVVTFPPLTISATVPSSDATDIFLTSAVIATFNHPVESSTVNSNSFFLQDSNGTLIPSTVNYDSSSLQAILQPNSSLLFSTSYTATITTTVQDAFGSSLGSNYSWSFSTVSAPPPLAITNTNPSNGQSGFPVASPLTITFNNPIDTTTVNANTFTLKDGNAQLVPSALSFNASNSQIILSPIAALLPLSPYTATVSTNFKDIFGGSLSSNYSWNFSTGGVLSIIGTYPVNGGGSNVGYPSVTAKFDNPLNSATVNNSTFFLQDASGTLIPSTVTYAVWLYPPFLEAILTPNQPLIPLAQYTATITTGVQDIFGNSLPANYSWTYIKDLYPFVPPH